MFYLIPKNPLDSSQIFSILSNVRCLSSIRANVERISINFDSLSSYTAAFVISQHNIVSVGELIARLQQRRYCDASGKLFPGNTSKRNKFHTNEMTNYLNHTVFAIKSIDYKLPRAMTSHSVYNHLR